MTLRQRTRKQLALTSFFDNCWPTSKECWIRQTTQTAYCSYANMVGGRVLYSLRHLSCLFLSALILVGVCLLSKPSSPSRPTLVMSSRCAASLKAPATRQSKRGAYVVALPFDSTVNLTAYFALCGDVARNPGPDLSPQRPAVQSGYTRNQLIDIGWSIHSGKVNHKLDSGIAATLTSCSQLPQPQLLFIIFL